MGAHLFQMAELYGSNTWGDPITTYPSPVMILQVDGKWWLEITIASVHIYIATKPSVGNSLPQMVAILREVSPRKWPKDECFLTL